MTRLVRFLTVAVAACVWAANGQSEFSGKAFKNDTPYCAAVRVEQPVGDSRLFYLDITNNCGKDIAAWTMDIQSLAPGQTEVVHTDSINYGYYPDMPPRVNGVPPKGYPTAGSTLHQPQAMNLPPPFVVTITSVLFMDRSAIGDPDDLSKLLGWIKDASVDEEKQLQLVKSISKYEDAKKILLGPDPTGEFTNLRNGLTNNDSPEAWEKWIGHEIRRHTITAKLMSDGMTLREEQ